MEKIMALTKKEQERIANLEDDLHQMKVDMYNKLDKSSYNYNHENILIRLHWYEFIAALGFLGVVLFILYKGISAYFGGC